MFRRETVVQTENIDKRSIVRNLIIFVLVFNALGWLGWLVASGGNTPEARDLGLLIWLVSPFLVSILIRLFSRDWVDLGLKPNFKGNAKGYLFSLLVFPVIVAIVVLIGAIFSGVSLANFKGGLFILAMGTAFLSTLIKNIFEEFAWRGYLTPKVNSLGINVLAGHLLVGLIWGFWHIPYYLGLLDHTQLLTFIKIC
jgi:membrane protease YdiL (CAAX protease family)